jgi:hypothetical protein
VRARVFLVKFVHILIFFFMAACLGYLLYAALTLTFNGWLLAAIVCLTIEGIILLVNRCHCPLTRLAERLGAKNGAITHLFLPPFLARNMFNLSFPLAIGVVVFLAARYLGR